MEKDKITINDIIVDSKYYANAKYYIIMSIIFLCPLPFLRWRHTLREYILVGLAVLFFITIIAKNVVPVIQLRRGKYWIEKCFVEEQIINLVKTENGLVYSNIYADLTPNTECYFIRTNGFDIGFIDGKVELDESLKSKIIVS